MTKLLSKEVSSKSRLVAFLLSGFFGTLGVHRMYCGKTGSGIAMLILTLTFVGIIVTSIWNLIDFILIIAGEFKDGDGNKITEWQV